MGNAANLEHAVRQFCEKLRSVIESGREIVIVTHIDADGLTSASIMAAAMADSGARYCVRAVSDLNSGVIQQLKSENHDFYVITDLGGGIASQLRKTLGDRWLIIDHHQISQEEILTDDESQILNAWKYGIDGGIEVSAGGMAYLVADALDKGNRGLSRMAVVSAVGDRQDQGEKKSFLGINLQILKSAQSLGLVNVDLDIMLTGRETRPLHESLAYTSFPYIDGLTWNRESSYALLKGAGIRLRQNGRWRVLAEFSQEEKSAILDAITKFVVTSGKIETRVIDDFVGYVYTISGEDLRSQLRDAREFSTLLNACGRIGKAGVGIAVCMGDRNNMLSTAEEIVNSYRATLRTYITTIFADKWRITDDGNNVFVNGDGLVAEEMLGAVSSLLSGSPSVGQRLVFVRTLGHDGTYKFSSRKSLGTKSQANLGLIMRHCAESFGGAGGGHSAAAGCRIPQSTLERFLADLKLAASDPKFATVS
jgi:RecJ-like exonuclease